MHSLILVKAAERHNNRRALRQRGEKRRFGKLSLRLVHTVEPEKDFPAPVSLPPEQFPDSSTLGGMHYQRQLERAAFLAGGGNYFAPAQLAGDFLARRPSSAFGAVQPTYRPGVTLCDLHQVLPVSITGVLESALVQLNQKLPGFSDPDAVLTAPETRSSAPVRILRDSTFQSTLRGLYPCGEGAGYAGGITSAAVDGIKCAEALIAAAQTD